MALKKLDITKFINWYEYDHYLIARNDEDELLAVYVFDSVKDVEAAINDLGWFKGYSLKMLLDVTGYKSIAEIAEAVATCYKTIMSKDGRYIQGVHIGNINDVK